MASFNKVILLGNLTRDPEVRYTPKGSAVCDLGIAVNRVYTTDSGVADQISNWESTVDLAAELKCVRDFGATVITQESSSYPRSLREIHAPPIVLYVWGELQERDHHAIGIIGARRTTHYGTESAKKLSYQLA